MAAATSKVILFSQVKVGNKTMQHPVAIFANESDAKAFATFMRLAHRANDIEAFKALDPKADLTESGELHKAQTWSMLKVRYAPSPDFGDEEDAATEDASTV